MPGPRVEIPVTYDGPDLETVAGHWGCDVEEVVARHRATEFVSAFCGFAPGFAYLSGLEVSVPRLATPRTRVPVGSVALAGTLVRRLPDGVTRWMADHRSHRRRAVGPAARGAGPARARAPA